MKTAKFYIFCGLGTLLLCIIIVLKSSITTEHHPRHNIARNHQVSTEREGDIDLKKETPQFSTKNEDDVKKSVSNGKLAKGNSDVTVEGHDKDIDKKQTIDHEDINKKQSIDHEDIDKKQTIDHEAQSTKFHARRYKEIMDNCKSECINSGGTQIPKLVYFIKTDPEWQFFEWVSVLSVHKYIKPDAIYVVSDVQLNPNCWWNRTVSIPKVRHVLLPKDQWLHESRGRKFTEKAHVCDYMKPVLLYEMGGIFMDTDAIAVKSFDPLLTHQVVLARDQGGFVVNGLMVAQKHSCFMCEFMRRSYNSFNGYWNQHTTYTLNPMAANTHSYKDVVVLKQYDGFFPFSPNKLRYEKFLINDANLLSHDMTKLYAIHLYHNLLTTKEEFVVIKNMTIDTYSWLSSSKSYGAQVFRSIIPNSFSEKHRYVAKVCEPLTGYP